MRAIAAWCFSGLVAVAPMARPLGAQESDNAALSTASAFFAALHEARWTDAAAMVDSASAQATRDFHLGTLVAWAKYRSDFAKELKHGSGAIVGFSSNGVLHPELIARYGATPVKGFGSAHTIAEIAALSPREFLARAFALSDSMFTAEAPRRRPPLTRTVVGDVIERDTIAHVLYRATGPEVHATDSLAVDILRLRRRPGGWLVDLPTTEHDLLGGVLVATLKDEDVR